MSEIITAHYDSTGQVENAVDDLIATGIPDEQIRWDRDSKEVSVTMPETARPEIQEILKRHQPTRVSR